MSDLKPQSSTESEYEVFEKGERALREEAMLTFWDEQQIFKKTLDKDAPKGEFVFYDGPPFATGLPHYGHLLPGTMKDLIPRYKTMQGYHVSRTWGWDCHGLPIENLIEKELNLATKKDIEAYGIDRFNEAARASVLRYDAQWKEIIPRMGRFVDMEHAYKSMDTNYTESVWWSFKNLFEKKLVYEDFKSMHLCPRCETTLANFEVNQGYKDITDISVVAKFELLDEPGTYVLAWTTTPWTLPGNVALAVGADIEYVQVQDTSEEGTAQYILAKHIFETDEELKKNFKSSMVSVVAEMKGSDLVGKKYRPVFDYFSNDETVEHRENGWRIYAASFVTVDDGTGVVHIAPAFGDDDMQLGREYTLPFIQHVQKDGHMVSAVTDFAGMMVKPKDDHQATDIEVIKWLAHNHKLFAKKKYIHSYPHCWRCDTPLLNYATTSWFLNIHKIKDRLLTHNASISWTPEHIRDGRFGKWLEGARDWALSRSRYWGAVLPVWKRKDGTGMVVIGSLEELQQYTKKSGNTYLVMRHGESESNVHGTVATTDWASPYPLTAKGREQVMEAVAQLKNEHIDLILCSPFIRARETAQIIAEALSLPTDNMVVEGLRERYVDPLYEGKTWSEVHTAVAELDNWYVDQLGEGESIEQVKIRATQLLYSLENNYQGKKILIITHGGVIDGMRIGVEGQSRERVYVQDEMKGRTRTNHGEIYPLSFIPLPHNERYELDLHRPYIDRLELVDTDGEPLELIKEVFDVWYESGSMPYASLHYPFENKELFDQTRFPADFIAEGLDQTRGWFYVLHVLATALFDKPAFKNVIVNGMVLAEDGKKMSKRLKNYPPIEKVANVYGADALRLFLMTSPAVRAEDVNLAEKSIAEVSQKVIGRLLNVMNMYELYATHEHAPERAVSPHALDQWILARLDQITREVTEQLDIYALDKAGRAFFDFVDDLSTWYIRRSRDRFKGDDAEDKAYALATTRYVMRQLALLMAPFTPFVADELWQKVKGEDDVESVHLASWPQNHVVNTSAEQILTNMQLTRDIVSQALELRNTAGIKVRQPLARLTIATNLDEQYLELIKDEVNVKEVLAGNELVLDTVLTTELRAEGVVRDVLRQVQAMRKDAGLNPEDRITLTIDTDQTGKELLETATALFASVAGVEQMHFAPCEGERVVVDDYTFTLQVKKL